MTLVSYISKPTWLHEEYEERNEEDNMTEQELRDKLEEVFNGLSTNEQIEIWNSYCEENRYDDDTIYDMEILDDYFYNCKPSEILQYAERNDFRTYESYFKFDGTDLESTNDASDWIEMWDLAGYMIDNEESFGIDEIQDLLDAGDC